jgi:type IV pilus assembly protein PilA
MAFNNPPQVFDELKEIAASGNPAPFAGLTQLEQAFKFNLRDDVLSNLKGELTLELDSIAPPAPAWKVIFAVSDANRLRQTLTGLLAAVHFDVERIDRDGVTYSTFRIPSGKPIEITYAFAAGYLILGSSQTAVADAVRLQTSGESLGKSKKLLAALPPGHSLNASGLLYEDPIAMAALRLQQFAPEMAASLVPSLKGSSPSVMCLYGDESIIREVSRGGAFDVGAAMIVAAIAIPNLLRSRMAANESSAVGSVRVVNVAQITYSMTYPKRGYAPNLASLGPDPHRGNSQSPDHGGFVDSTFANESCTADAWCAKSGFNFRVTAVCKQHSCSEYVVLATPVTSSTGTRSFCSTPDGLIRFKFGPPLTESLTVSECRSWPPIY